MHNNGIDVEDENIVNLENYLNIDFITPLVYGPSVHGLFQSVESDNKAI